MKLTSEEARNLLEKDRNNVKDDRWIEHCICVGDTAGRIAQALKEKGYDDELLKESGLFTYEKGIREKF